MVSMQSGPAPGVALRLVQLTILIHNLGLQELIQVLQCPACGSDSVHRSRTRSRWERLRRQITLKAPFRCHACGTRFWRLYGGAGFTHEEIEAANRAIASSPFEGAIELPASAAAASEGALADLAVGEHRPSVGEPELATLDARFSRRGTGSGPEGSSSGQT